ncbi:MAG: S46 family peptidase [Crocinitomicaceae bacterium]|nr:S46 family peptidase [Crocinitomicaceae bacterium]
MKKILGTLLMVTLFAFNSKADEGMWLLHFLKDQNIEDMQKKGLKLTAEQIYSINNASLKDAIISMGGFCTGEIISEKGLFLTNHHCGYDAIADASTPESDYLTYGFWAKQMDQEIPVKGLTATIVVRIEDVTADINAKLNDGMSYDERQKAIMEEMEALKAKATKDTHYDAFVRNFFEGNEFYLFVVERFKDVRMVGAPPSSVGKYGGDTDNWMWPRHTGDFSMFRIYAGEDNKPADFSADNKPYQPKHHLPISIKGVQKNDYAMVLGFPGSTDRYLSSYGVNHAITLDQPTRVEIRGKKLEIMKKHMNQSDAVRINYASKYAQVANYWKYFIGQTEQLKKNKVYGKKKKIEDDFVAWANKEDDRKKYRNIMTDFEEAYKVEAKYSMNQVYFFEAIYQVDFFQHVFTFISTRRFYADDEKLKEFNEKIVPVLKMQAEEWYSTKDLPTEKELVINMLNMYAKNVPADQQTEKFKSLVAKSKGDFTGMVEKAWDKSAFTNKENYLAFLDKFSVKGLEKDLFYQLVKELFDSFQDARSNDEAVKAEQQLEEANRLFVQGLRKMNPDKKYYPNANSTLRLTYGSVLDYSPADAVHYDYTTTTDGILEKRVVTEDKTHEFYVPQDLVDKINEGDFGQYGQDGKLIVNFLTNNDITGGNSGSPVINGEGHLIGTAFDGNWEAMSGDIFFEENIQRTICVDARYILWIIDKYAGAGNLIEEMTIIK